MAERIKILFLAANPQNAPYYTRLDHEAREIDLKIQEGPERDSFEIIIKLAVRPGDLPKLLMEHRPHVVHFSGHGDKEKGIFLEDIDGNMKAVSKQALIGLFSTLRDNIRIVFLSACHSKEQIEGLQETIDFIIVMNETVGDSTAVIFSAHFYQSLAFGRSVRDAFEVAKNRLELEGIKETEIAELLVRKGADASQSLVNRQTGRISRSNRLNAELSRGERLRILFSSVTWLSLIISAILLTGSVARIASDEDDWLDSASEALQYGLLILASILVALAGISLIQPAHPQLRKTAHLRILKINRSGKKIIIIITVLLFALGLRLLFPTFAGFYNERGFENQLAGNVSQARKDYERALRLKPDYAQAHYNLATTYEDLNPEKAADEYQIAIRNDNKFYAAYNNLAHLYLLRGNPGDYDRALGIMNQAIDLSPSDARVQYSLYKNLGWASYGLKNYAQAEIYLRRAISLREEDGGAAAHCLLAYVLHEQRKPGAMDEWVDCVRLEPGEEDVEPEWLEYAREQLMKDTAQ